MSMIKLSRIVFEGPIQIGAMTVREYTRVDGVPARYDAHLHGDLQCVQLRDPTADVTIYIPLRCIRSMEAADKDTLPASSYRASDGGEGLRNMQEEFRKQLAFKVPVEDDAEPDAPEPMAPVSRTTHPHLNVDEITAIQRTEAHPSSGTRRRGRPRTKHLTPPSDKL